VSLDLLEPSGPVQACNGTAFPLFYIFGGIVRFSDQYKLGKGMLDTEMWTYDTSEVLKQLNDKTHL
jgi:hypothetical protein